MKNNTNLKDKDSLKKKKKRKKGDEELEFLREGSYQT